MCLERTQKFRGIFRDALAAEILQKIKKNVKIYVVLYNRACKSEDLPR